MKRIIATLAAAVGLTVLAPVAACASDAPTRVLIVGDSVTQGGGGDYSWRYFASRELGNRVDFVGQHVGTSAPNSGYNWDGEYADPNFDSDHAARWGLSLHEMRYEPSAIAPSIASLVAAHQPDVVVETLGINDLTYRYGDAWVAEAVDNARQFVLDARAVKPDVDVVLGTLPQLWVADRVGRYNEALRVLAGELTTDASRVTVTATAQWDRGVDTYDEVHPSRVGEEKLAAVVVDALAPLLPTPAPAPTPQPTPAAEVAAASTVEVPATTAPVPSTPAAPRKVRATAVGSKVVVTWRKAEGAARYDASCSRKAKAVTGAKAVLRVQAASCKVRSTNDAGVSRWVRATVR